MEGANFEAALNDDLFDGGNDAFRRLPTNILPQNHVDTGGPNSGQLAV